MHVGLFERDSRKEVPRVCTRMAGSDPCVCAALSSGVLCACSRVGRGYGWKPSESSTVIWQFLSGSCEQILLCWWCTHCTSFPGIPSLNPVGLDSVRASPSCLTFLRSSKACLKMLAALVPRVEPSHQSRAVTEERKLPGLGDSTDLSQQGAHGPIFRLQMVLLGYKVS